MIFFQENIYFSQRKNSTSNPFFKQVLIYKKLYEPRFRETVSLRISSSRTYQVVKIWRMAEGVANNRSVQLGGGGGGILAWGRGNLAEEADFFIWTRNGPGPGTEAGGGPNQRG